MVSKKFGDHGLPWLVFILFLLLTALATWYVWATTRAADRAGFENAVQATSDAIEARLSAYIDLMLAARGVLISEPFLGRDELRGYLSRIDFQQRYPGIQGIGLTVRVNRDEIPRLEQELREEGFQNFRVWPETGQDRVHAIVVLEPGDRRNLAAMGYNMFSEPVRREAMERARDTGMPASSGRVTLVQEIFGTKQPGFLIYTPVYQGGMTPGTVEERREKLVGFIYVPFRAHDLLRGIFGTQQRPEVAFRIRDEGELLFESAGIPEWPRFTASDEVEVAGRTWRLEWISRSSRFASSAILFSAGTFAGGLIIAILLAMLISVQLRARTQAEQTAERLRVSEAALQEANRAKDEFLATLSHELRTPMTAVMGWSQMLAAGSIDEGTRDTALEAIHQSARVQAQLIDDLLDVSRITAGKMRIEPRPVELGPIVSAAVDTVRAAADAKGVNLATEIQEGVRIRGDAPRLQQVIWNLVSNGVKFTPRGGSVSVVVREESGQALVLVTDTGQGIASEFMPYLFERFRQADSSSRRAHMGLGLGLAIVRHLVELHGGTVTAESAGKGRGSTFCIRLPSLAPQSQSRDEAAETPLLDPLRGARILIVDDDENVRAYVKAVFRGCGSEIVAAESLKTALAVLEEFRPDVILSDIGMPEADGFDLLEAIRRDERLRNTSVIALTAFAMEEDRERAEAAGFDFFIAKPVEAPELRAAVAGVIGNASATVAD
jgi:signal transduction histidine kinase/CheY-like chemotaxis protein